jgi:hypothetical protein
MRLDWTPVHARDADNPCFSRILLSTLALGNMLPFTPADCCRCFAAAAVCAAGYLGAGKVSSTQMHGQATAQLMLHHEDMPSLPTLGT